MYIYLLSLLLLWTGPITETPNYYSSFASAREASKSNNKEMLVFFTNRTCSDCDAAWNAYAKDGSANQKYISTWMDPEDFDGGVLYENYELTMVPSWVVLSVDGRIKEKWQGGWKDASGNPTLYVQDDTKKQKSTEGDKTMTPSTASSGLTTVSTPNTSSPRQTANAAKPTTPSSSPSTSESSTKATPAPANKTGSPVTGYYIQAGYFGSETNAQKLIAELKGKGFDHFTIKSTLQNNSTFFRVISAPYTDEIEANKAIQTLSQSGIKATVKKASEL